MGQDLEFWYFQKIAGPARNIIVCGLSSAKDFVALIAPAQRDFWVVKTKNDPQAIPLSQSPLIGMLPPTRASAAPDSAKPAAATVITVGPTLVQTDSPDGPAAQTSPAPFRAEAFVAKAVLGPAITPRFTADRTDEKKVPIAGLDRRAHQRITVKLNIMLVSGKNIFSTHSLDVSLGGIKVEAPVPKEFLNATCLVFITSSNSSLNVQFEAKVLESTPHGSRIQFGVMSEHSRMIFENWIERRLNAA